MVKRICWTLFAAWVVFAVALLAGEARADGLVLVEDGVSRAPIVVFEGAPPFTRRAADELASYIEKASGARPDVLVGAPNPVPDRAIWVGYQPVLDRLFPGVEFGFAHPEETLVVANENHLAIAGRDRWDPERLVVEGRNWTIDGWQTEYGTANAVYTFLQEHLGVRWLWPGELGEDVPDRPALSFAPFEQRYHPQFRSRSLFRLSALGDSRGHSHEWVRRQRLQLDSLRVPGGHGFTDWWNRFHEDHPEYFALQPDGARSGFPGPGTTKICLSNPAVWERVLANIEESLERDPTRTSFNLQENDSHSRGICICQNCLAWDHPGGQPWRYTWQGLTQGYVAMTDRYIRFWNTIADMVKERFPDRGDIVLFAYAYGPSKPLPVEATFNEGILYGYVGHFPFREEAARRDEKAEMAKWAKVAPALMYRPNLWYWGGNLGLPEVAMSKTIEDFGFLAENRCVGLWIDTCWEHWVTQLPQYYVMAQMAWNPRLDGHAVLDDYYRRGFGPAAGEVRRYWAMMEDAYDGLSQRGGLPRGGEQRLALYREVFSDSFLDRAEALLGRAGEKAAGEPPVYRERIAFVRAGLDYVRLFMQSSEAVEAARMGDAGARALIAANWTKIEAILRDYPIALSRRSIVSRAGWLMGEE